MGRLHHAEPCPLSSHTVPSAGETLPITLLLPCSFHLQISTSSEKPCWPFCRLGWAPLTPCPFLGSPHLAMETVHRTQITFRVIIDTYCNTTHFPWMVVTCLEQGASWWWWFPPAAVLLRFDWRTALYKLKVGSVMTWLTYITKCNNLVNIHYPQGYKKSFSLVMRTFRICSLSNF